MLNIIIRSRDMVIIELSAKNTNLIAISPLLTIEVTASVIL